MAKKRTPAIKLNKDRRGELMILAANEIYAKACKTWFGQEMMEYRTYLGGRMNSWLEQEFTAEELDITLKCLEKVSQGYQFPFRREGNELNTINIDNLFDMKRLPGYDKTTFSPMERFLRKFDSSWSSYWGGDPSQDRKSVV